MASPSAGRRQLLLPLLLVAAACTMGPFPCSAAAVPASATTHSNSNMHRALRGSHHSHRSLLSQPNAASAYTAGATAPGANTSASPQQQQQPPPQQQQLSQAPTMPYAALFSQDQDKAAVIAVLKEASSLPLLEQLCGATDHLGGGPTSAAASGLGDFTTQTVTALWAATDTDTAAGSSISKTMQCAGALRGLCRRLYRAALTGFAGVLTQHHLDVLVNCLGEHLSHVEADGKVYKAERSSYEHWWNAQPPPGVAIDADGSLHSQPQPQEGTSGPAVSTLFEGASQPHVDLPVHAMSGDAATSSAGFTRSTGHSPGHPGVTSDTGDGEEAHKVDGQAGSALSNLAMERWLLADVGLRSQRMLAAGGSSSSFRVAAASGSWNDQNPGVSVDLQALSEPAVKAEGSDQGVQGNAQALDQALKKPGPKQQSLIPALWNLDRLDQQQLPLDAVYHFGAPSVSGTGQGVTIYTLDSGIIRTHQEFQDWSGQSRAYYGADFVDNKADAADCDGHGSHVASTAVGRSVGVAKQAKVVAVRVLDCDGEGKISNVIAGLEWIATNAQRPAVVTLSLGVPAGTWSQAMEAAVKSTINDLGIPLVIAAGNSAEDCCGISPGRVPEAITVGASNLPNKFSATRQGQLETLYTWSNTGACVKLFAPGVDIFGACGGAKRCPAVTDTSYTWASGTSMAVPHVAGVAALYLEQHPQATPAEVQQALLNAATVGRLDMSAMKEGTPNRLLYSAVLS